MCSPAAAPSWRYSFNSHFQHTYAATYHDDVADHDRRDAAQHLDLLVAHVLRRERHGRLHRDDGQHLQQMVLHDVADDADVVEVAAAALSAKGLLERDLRGQRGYVVENFWCRA